MYQRLTLRRGLNFTLCLFWFGLLFSCNGPIEKSLTSSENGRTDPCSHLDSEEVGIYELLEQSGFKRVSVKGLSEAESPLRITDGLDLLTLDGIDIDSVWTEE